MSPITSIRTIRLRLEDFTFCLSVSGLLGDVNDGTDDIAILFYSSY